MRAVLWFDQGFVSFKNRNYIIWDGIQLELAEKLFHTNINFWIKCTSHTHTQKHEYNILPTKLGF